MVRVMSVPPEVFTVHGRTDCEARWKARQLALHGGPAPMSVRCTWDRACRGCCQCRRWPYTFSNLVLSVALGLAVLAAIWAALVCVVIAGTYAWEAAAAVIGWAVQ